MLNRPFNPWVVLTMRAFQLSWEAQNVIALRMLRLASGDVRGQAELNRMVVEKITAAAEAQVAAAAAMMNGHKDHVIAGKALTVYKKRVRQSAAVVRALERRSAARHLVSRARRKHHSARRRAF
jgi:hypothetical protein